MGRSGDLDRLHGRSDGGLLDHASLPMSHRSFPKPPPRLESRMQAKRDAERAWEACKRAVDVRDQFKCRCCQRKVIKTISVDPARAEHHHLVSRRLLPKEKLFSPDVVILVCLECHGKLTRYEILVTQTDHRLVIDGRSYPNANADLIFLPSPSCSTPSIESAFVPSLKDDPMTD